MSHLGVLLLVVVPLTLLAIESASSLPAELLSSDYSSERESPARGPNSLEYGLKRGLLESRLLEGRERRSGSNMGSSFIRFGRAGPGEEQAVSQPHTRSDIIIRYGRDGLNGRLTRLRQERMRRLARLALICAAKSQDEGPANSAEEKILREMCKDAPLHPTVPDFV